MVCLLVNESCHHLQDRKQVGQAKTTDEHMGGDATKQCREHEESITQSHQNMLRVSIFGLQSHYLELSRNSAHKKGFGVEFMCTIDGDEQLRGDSRCHSFSTPRVPCRRGSNCVDGSSGNKPSAEGYQIL
eukprot:1721287-Amphidinium_carterae.1